ncbi:enoyl-CoA hydratase/isomerase family protein [Paraburkholderia sediminicola]|uniref:enoyl-CoA hydratase/isomerase family protein n=1 Tax=Paraburkholderia sediminicola TaxID=458836 RepID=UPI0038B74DEC
MTFDYVSENLRLEIDKDAPIGRLFINRPDKLNAITMAMRQEIVRFFDMIEEDERIHVIVLRGATAGRGFSAGGDIPQFLEVPPRQLANLAYSMSAPERCTKPVIAVIDGHCYGGGLELACSCDFRIATPAGRFAFPEVTLGALPGSGGTQRAVRLMGVGRARALVQTGRPITAEQAERWGLVTWLYQPDELDKEVDALAHHLAKLSPLASAFAKQVVSHAPDTSLAGGFQMEGKAMTVLCGMEDFQEGVAAWKEKRPARFTGR